LRRLQLKDIIDYWEEGSPVAMEDKYPTTKNGQQKLKKNTQGFEFCDA